jgi:hypothetical protein
MKNIFHDVKELMISNINHRKSFVAQLVIIFILACAYFQQSYQLQYYYNTILGRILIIFAVILSCNYRYMFVTISLIICIFFISVKTYEGFSLTDVDSISSSIKSNLPASMVSLPPNPTPQNIYDYLNKQVCAAGNADIYKQIIESPSSSDDAKVLATNAFGFNTAMCKSGAPFYQQPQALFDDFKNSCSPTLTGQDKKMADLASSISADPNSVNTFSAPLVAIAKWFSTTRSAICGAAATSASASSTVTSTPSNNTSTASASAAKS